MGIGLGLVSVWKMMELNNDRDYWTWAIETHDEEEACLKEATKIVTGGRGEEENVRIRISVKCEEQLFDRDFFRHKG